MKKRLFIFIVLVLMSSSLFAFEVYLAPMTGANGIPMNPKREPGNMHYTPITGFAAQDGVEIAEKDQPWKESSLYNSLPEGCYTDSEMIALGGIKGMKPFEAYNKSKRAAASLEITATCPNGFYFVSQSNPAYKRPFALYVIPKIITYPTSNPNDVHSKFGKERVLSNDNYFIEFSYYDLKPDVFTFDKDFTFKHQIWFDMVLVLPGDVKNDVLEIGEERYPLTEADDYSAVVTISMKASIPESNFTTTKTIDIPFSGFYKSKPADRDEATVSMYVHPAAAAGNLNMRIYTNQQIADLEVMSVDTIPKKDGKQESPSKTYTTGIFLSSSPSPTEPGGHFKLVKENLDYDQLTNLTQYNSVEYDVIMVDKKDKTNIVRYDGTMAVDSGLNASNCKNKKYEKLIVPAITSIDNTHSIHVDYWYYSGDIYIQIKDNSQVMMEAGRYTSTIYVHVLGL